MARMRPFIPDVAAARRMRGVHAWRYRGMEWLEHEGVEGAELVGDAELVERRAECRACARFWERAGGRAGAIDVKRG